MTTERSIEVDVEGGSLHVGVFGDGPNVLVAAHGITGNHRSMRPLADALGSDFTIFAPDLRGRGRSANITGPFGMAAHADDFVAVLDHNGIASATVLGHSMGGFVAVVMAHRAPERVQRVVLVDGGLPLDLGPLREMPVEDILKAVIGPALERLRMTFPSVDAYLDYWRPHPALADDWSEYVADHYTYDLVGEPPELRSSVREDAVVADGGSELVEPDVTNALAAFTHPGVLLRAPRGIMNQVPPLYTDDVAAEWLAKLPSLRDVLIPEVNHYTILMSERGAHAVAEVVRESDG